MALDNNFILTTNLTLEIEKTNSLLSSWYDAKVQSLQKLDNEYTTAMAECEIAGKTLYETNSQLEVSRPINQAIKEQQQRELENIKHMNQQNKQQVQSMTAYLKEMEILEAQLSEKQQLIRQEHDYLKKAMEQKLQDFAHGTKFYQKLGLDFQKSTGDCMKFVFSQIDSKEPLKQFFFVIFVDEHNQYQLVETSPALPKTRSDDILRLLNQTNNIAYFVVQMRKAFVELCK